MSETRYLIQKGTNRFFIWTPMLAKRKDMSEINENTIQVRIKHAQDELARTRELIKMERSGTVPEMLTDSAVALKNIEAELAGAQKELEGVRSGDEPDPLSDEPQSDAEADQMALMNAVENDPDIIAIRKMRSKKAIADYRAKNFGIDYDPAELDKVKLDDLKNQACIERTRIIQEQMEG